MFKLLALVFAAVFVCATARPGYLASSPIAYTTHHHQPVVRAHYHVPVVHSHAVASNIVRTIATPVVHSVATPVVHINPVYHSHGAVPLIHHYGVLKN